MQITFPPNLKIIRLLFHILVIFIAHINYFASLFQLEFIGVRGSDYRSDMALDAISATNGSCDTGKMFNLLQYLFVRITKVMLVRLNSMNLDLDALIIY